MTGHSHRPLPPNWNQIPGARGCTPQVCSFKNNYELIKKLGVSFLFGLSSQSN
jgi:peroxiredoxin